MTMGNYEKQIADLCHKMMTEQFLDYLNQCGCELGYPFVMYSDGECGKGLVSSDGKHNAVLKVLGSFKDNAKVDGIKKQRIKENSVSLSSVDEQRLKNILSIIQEGKHKLLSADDECFLILKGTFRLFILYLNEVCALSFSAFKIIIDEDKLVYFAAYIGMVTELRDDEVDYILDKASKEIMMIMFVSSSFLGFSEEQEKKLVDSHRLDLLTVYDGAYVFEKKTWSYLRNLAQTDPELKKWLDDRLPYDKKL